MRAQQRTRQTQPREKPKSIWPTIKEEEAIQIKLLAMDYLIENRVEPEKLSMILPEISTQKNIPIMLKAKKYMEQ